MPVIRLPAAVNMLLLLLQLASMVRDWLHYHSRFLSCTCCSLIQHLSAWLWVWHSLSACSCHRIRTAPGAARQLLQELVLVPEQLQVICADQLALPEVPCPSLEGAQEVHAGRVLQE